ncbi:MAG: hypothetical protein K8S23_12030 [Candidatus Cloacimonetes bacterium]|nr:hypothetical protein [Candidatus Cloacimonadota bacterium]
MVKSKLSDFQFYSPFLKQYRDNNSDFEVYPKDETEVSKIMHSKSEDYE